MKTSKNLNMIREPLRVEVADKRVLLEATRKEKEFQLVQVKIKKTWNKKWTSASRSLQYTTDSFAYEFNWRNVGSSKWGRTQILRENGNAVNHAAAFKIFFKALEYSENMTFRELDELGYYKETI